MAVVEGPVTSSSSGCGTGSQCSYLAQMLVPPRVFAPRASTQARWRRVYRLVHTGSFFFLLARLNSAFDGVRQPSSISNFPVLVPIPRYQVLIQGTTHRLPCTCPLMSQVPSHILIEVSSVWWVFRMKLPVHHGGTLYDICCGGQETHTDDIFSHYMTVFKGIVCTRPIAGNPG